ncbi:hypothetical protein EAF04_004040 [Stromatinia cepivora]|nr:hypothetical protein EAF04_004040 [Stromatinia cepivora]
MYVQTWSVRTIAALAIAMLDLLRLSSTIEAGKLLICPQSQSPGSASKTERKSRSGTPSGGKKKKVGRKYSRSSSKSRSSTTAPKSSKTNPAS